MSFSRSLYDFATVSIETPTALWPSAARECGWIGDVVELIRSDLTLEWSSQVVTSDACLSGVAAHYSYWDARDVESIGSLSEKWRYKTAVPAIRARDHAFKGLDPFTDTEG